MKKLLVSLFVLLFIATSASAGPVEGFPQSQVSSGGSYTASVQPRGEYSSGLECSSYIGATTIASDAAEAGTTTSTIAATGHAARVGDIIRFTSGTYDLVESRVAEVDTNEITLGNVLSGAPGVGDTFDILRPVTLGTSISGELSSASEYVEDSAHTNEDVGVTILTKRTNTAASSAGTDGDYATLNTDFYGKLWTTGTHLEDSAHVSTHEGNFVLSVVNNSADVLAAQGDYAPIASNTKGAVFVDVYKDMQASTAQGLLKSEDGASTSSDAGVVVLGRRSDAIGGTTNANGDYGWLHLDATNHLWIAGSQIEDEAHATGDRMVAVATLTQNSPTGTVSAQGDYGPLVTNTATGSLYVQATGTNKTVEVALTVDTAAYAAGDYINDANDITDLALMGRNYIFGGEIREVIITDEGAEGANLEVWFFDTDPTNSTFTDNEPFTVHDSDLVNVCCVVPITSHYAAAASGVSIGRPTNCVCKGGTTSLYAAIVAREAVTFDDDDDVTIRVTIDQD